MTSASVAAEYRLRAALAGLRGSERSQIDRWRTALAISFYAGDLSGAERILDAAVNEVPPVVALDQILAPAMHDIGMLWERDEVSVADEHLATVVAHRLIAAAAPRMADARTDRGIALLVTPEPERHTAALLMAEHVLHAAGYATILLGSGVPTPALRAALARHRPEVVAVSATMTFPEELSAALDTVAEECPAATVFIGGSAASLAPRVSRAQVVPGMEALLRIVSEHEPRRALERLRLPARAAGRPPPGVRPNLPAVGGGRVGGGSDDWLARLVPREAEAERARRALLGVAEKLSNSGSWAWNQTTDEIAWSANTFRILEMDPELGRPTYEGIFDRTHPGDRARMEDLFARARRDAELPEFMYRKLGPGGVTRYMHAVLAIKLAQPDGAVLVGWLRDITESRDAEREIAAHVAVTEALSSWVSVERDSEQLLRTLATALGFTRGVLWTPDDGALVARKVWAVHGMKALAGELAGMRLAPGHGLAGRAWESGSPVTVSNASREPRYEFRATAARDGLLGSLTIPIVAGGEVLAVIGLSGPDELELTGRLKATLTSIGHEMGAFFAGRVGQLRGTVLSARELEILQLAAVGLAGPEIARRLHLSPATVKTHFENIYAKYGVDDRVAAVAKALREGLID